MRWRWLAAALLVAGACGFEGDAVPGVTFRVHVEPVAEGLEISYRLVNESNGTLLVLNRVPRQETTIREDLESDPEAVYVTRRSWRIVELAKRTFTKPDNLALYAPYVLEATVLGRESSIAETLTVPRPLEGRSLYSPHDGRLDDVDPDAEHVVFCVGVVLVPPNRDFGDDGDVARIGHGIRQRLLCSDVVDVGSA